jgi:hypothetical protein
MAETTVNADNHKKSQYVYGSKKRECKPELPDRQFGLRPDDDHHQKVQKPESHGSVPAGRSEQREGQSLVREDPTTG